MIGVSTKMQSTLVSTFPLLLVLASFFYAAVVGERIHRSTGAISILGVAVTLLGVTVGWFLERFLPVSSGIDDVTIARNSRLGVSLLFFLVAATAFLAVTLIRRDVSGLSKSDPAFRKCAFLASAFILAVGIPAHDKLATYLAIFLPR
jgi:hypothetical protein